MSWKNTRKTSLSDALVIEHKSLSELDGVHHIINWNEIEQTLSNLYSSVRGAPAITNAPTNQDNNLKFVTPNCLG